MHKTQREQGPSGTSRISRGPRKRRMYGLCVTCFNEPELVPPRRCHDCDREVCTICIVGIAETGESICPECFADRQSSSAS